MLGETLVKTTRVRVHTCNNLRYLMYSWCNKTLIMCRTLVNWQIYAYQFSFLGLLKWYISAAVVSLSYFLLSGCYIPIQCTVMRSINCLFESATLLLIASTFLHVQVNGENESNKFPALYIDLFDSMRKFMKQNDGL